MVHGNNASGDVTILHNTQSYIYLAFAENHSSTPDANRNKTYVMQNVEHYLGNPLLKNLMFL